VVVSVPPASYRGPVRLSDPSAAPRLSRRSVLLAAAATAVAVAACTKDPADGSSPSAAPAPDELLRRLVVAAEADLVALYASTAHAHPQLAVALGAVEDRHRHHFAAVAASGAVAAATRARSTADPTSPSAGATATALPVPADPAAALAALRSAEEAAAQARLEDCLQCEDPALAELIAAVAAGEAANGVLLPAAS
jgi:hypothetical protein